MKIAFYHSAALPVKTYGGTERILFWHMKELASLGHEVIYIGHPDSKVEEFGIKHIPLNSDDIKGDLNKYVPKDVDILHLQFNYLNEEFHCPVIYTIHGNGQPGEVFNKNSVFVSKAHANLHGSESFVYNAFDFNEYPAPENLNNKSKDHLLFLAKVSWRLKNIKDSKRAAKSLKKHLHIAGGKSFSLSKYIHNYGFIGGEEKLNLMKKCDAIVFPVLWPEPFGMAMVEAMTQGLPVFGSNFGSLPEVIGEAGKACSSYDEFLNSLKNWECKLSPSQIRDYAISSFDIRDYSKKYLDLYEKVISGQSLSADAPYYTLDKKPNKIYTSF